MESNELHWAWTLLVTLFFIVLFSLLIFYVVPQLAKSDEIRRDNCNDICNEINMDYYAYDVCQSSSSTISEGNYTSIKGCLCKEANSI